MALVVYSEWSDDVKSLAEEIKKIESRLNHRFNQLELILKLQRERLEILEEEQK